MTINLRFLPSLTLAAAFGLASGCDDDDAEAAPETETDTDAGESADTTDPAGSSGSDGGSGTGADPSGDDSDSSEEDELLPNGSQCVTGSQCESGKCFVAGALGGTCGECEGDADCEFGCTLPNLLSDPPTGSVCNDGSLGQGCESAEACSGEGFVCASIIDVPGLLEASSCSECASTEDCTGEQVCDVTIDIVNITGSRSCIDPGTVPNGEFCELADSGDDACEFFCGSADIMGLVEFGVCGECRTVDDTVEGCAEGEICVPPTVDLEGNVTAAFCE